MRQSTPVSSDTALAEFRAATADSSDEDSTTRTSGKSSDRATGKSDRGRTGSTAARTTGGQKAAVATTTTGSATTSTERRQSQPQARTLGRPDEGVYEWRIDGFEEIPGTHRELPERSNRIITHEEGYAWTEHHIYSEQKEQWFGLVNTQEGVAATTVRNRVVFGPVTNDKTVVFDPMMFVSRFPLKVGQEWEGKWSGKTSGEYTGRTFERTTMAIGGKEVEVWGTEVHMTMRGDIEGTNITRSWVAPDYFMVVKQYQETRVKSGPADYYSEWTGQVLSLEPRR